MYSCLSPSSCSTDIKSSVMFTRNLFYGFATIFTAFRHSGRRGWASSSCGSVSQSFVPSSTTARTALTYPFALCLTFLCLSKSSLAEAHYKVSFSVCSWRNIVVTGILYSSGFCLFRRFSAVTTRVQVDGSGLLHGGYQSWAVRGRVANWQAYQ